MEKMETTSRGSLLRRRGRLYLALRPLHSKATVASIAPQILALIPSNENRNIGLGLVPRGQPDSQLAIAHAAAILPTRCMHFGARCSNARFLPYVTITFVVCLLRRDSSNTGGII